MTDSRVSQESVEKYYNALVELNNVLKYTTIISLNSFCIKNNLSKNLPSVLKKGGIVKCITKGKYSEWEWISIEPNRQMANKSVQMLGELNPPRKLVVKKEVKEVIKPKLPRGGARKGSGRKTKLEEIKKHIEYLPLFNKKKLNLKKMF
jgi:hypothetical protein